MRQRQRPCATCQGHQTRGHAGVGLPGETVEDGRRRALGQRHHGFVHRVAVRQGLQCVGHGTLVAGDGRIGKAHRARGAAAGAATRARIDRRDRVRHVLARKCQGDLVGAIGQRRVKERVVRADRRKAALHRPGRQDAVAARGREIAVGADMDHRPAERGRTAHRHAVAGRRGRVGFHAIG
ncbi:hypothetical protein D3C87_1206220 [compost metagenome]